jgi:tryptophanyl-tRNA synthetase
MSRRISGFKPTGRLQLGNYVGAIRPTVEAQDATPPAPTTAFIADLHALTASHDPTRTSELTFEVAALLLAAGLDPERATIYVQSHLTAHTELHYLLECTTGYGEALRMIQFKEKGGTGSRLALLTYPVLMAADVLLHDADEVPVGADQRQHVELARDVATRFNLHYGQTFVVPRAVHPAVAARLGDLVEPTTKMGKTNASAAGVLFLLDPPDVIRRKVLRAVTDTETEVRYDPTAKPGVSNLLEILAACTGDAMADLAPRFAAYGPLKAAVTETVVALLRPIQIRYRELTADPAYVHRVLADGAERARDRADATVRRARTAIGLLPARRAGTANHA